MWNRIMLIICSVFVLTGPASTGDMTHIPDRDFDKLAYGNKNPTGIWSDGTTMWVVDRNAKIYAYNLRTRARDSGRDFNTLKDAGNESPAGIWSDGTTMWVVDHADGGIYAYNMRSKAHDPDKDFYLALGNGVPEGIWSDGTTMWVMDSAYHFDKIYAYNMRSKAHDPNKDFNTLKDAGEQSTDGIWSDGATMWVADGYRHKMYAYNMRSKARDRNKDFDLAAGNTSPTGIWSDGTTMWVADYRDHIYAYGGQVGSSDQAIQDFSMKIKGTTGTLKICVRDHECEDGDKISVDVNGSTIFSGEIDNDWDCYNLTVWSGESYAVELTALNGTGYKGDCSYRDENTGEIRVTGENTETQVWRHRGGAGSKARIIVETVR